MNVLPFELQTQIIAALCEGMSIRGAERAFEVNRDTVMYLGRNVGEGYGILHDRIFHGLKPSYIEVDEAWSYVGKKEGHLDPGDPKEYGDQYSYIAMDADNKAILSYLVGKRNEKTTIGFAMDLRSRVVGRPQITSDGFNDYVKAVALAFGRNVDYAMLIKLYRAECSVEAKRRYKPAKVVETEKHIVFGNPRYSHISTAYIERQNLTLRTHLRRFTRLASGFSKTLRNHEAAMSLYVGFYNFCRPHESLAGDTPAMAIGLADEPWGVSDLVTYSLIEAGGGTMTRERG